MRLGQCTNAFVGGMVYYRPPLRCCFGHQEQTTVKAWAEWNWLDSSFFHGRTFSEPFGICGLLPWFTNVAIVTNVRDPVPHCTMRRTNGLRLSLTKLKSLISCWLLFLVIM